MNIYGAINAIMAEVGAVGKDKKNAQQGFMYRGIDDVMNALQPALVKHGVFVSPEILESTREERVSKQGSNLIYSVCKIKYTFFATDGTSVSATVIGEGMDSGDKATNKAMSIAFKYACFQVFCIPTEEMKDPDSETPPASVPVTHICADCHQKIVGVKKNGEPWSADNIAIYTKRKFGRELCATCYNAALKAEKE